MHKVDEFTRNPEEIQEELRKIQNKQNKSAGINGICFLLLALMQGGTHLFFLFMSAFSFLTCFVGLKYFSGEKGYIASPDFNVFDSKFIWYRRVEDLYVVGLVVSVFFILEFVWTLLTK